MLILVLFWLDLVTARNPLKFAKSARWILKKENPVVFLFAPRKSYQSTSTNRCLIILIVCFLGFPSSSWEQK